MPLTIKPASGSGSMTLISVAGTTTNDTLTLPAKTGNVITSADSGTVTQTMLGTNVAGNGPAFLATMTSNQSVTTTTWTKLQFNNEVKDANSNYDPSTYKFTAPVSGYYQFNIVATVGVSSGTITLSGVGLYRGVGAGASSVYVYPYLTSTTLNDGMIINGCAAVYLDANDYVETYGLILGTSPSFKATGFQTAFQGFLVRAG